MDNKKKGKFEAIKEKLSRFYQCELRTFRIILGIK
mgnify:CR=1 FL=1